MSSRKNQDEPPLTKIIALGLAVAAGMIGVGAMLTYLPDKPKSEEIQVPRVMTYSTLEKDCYRHIQLHDFDGDGKADYCLEYRIKK